MTSEGQRLHCPQCGSTKLWRDGKRYSRQGEIQRWLCRNCGFRFSETKLHNRETAEHLETIHRQDLKMHEPLIFSRQVCVSLARDAKNLAEEESLTKKRAAGATAKQTNAEVKGKLVEYAWWMNKQGYAKETIRGYLSCLRTLIDRGANLYDPESVKDVMARQKWSANRRRNVVNAYTLFLKKHGLSWEKPRIKVTRKIPFIPTEAELDALIAGSGKKTATFLQLLKETAMRAGEAKRLLWTDIDFERQIITLNAPEKGSLPRIWKVSRKLIAMLNALPRKSLRVFGDGPVNSLKSTFLKTRKRLAAKLQNPRLLRISFHTFRHWKATMEYHRTKDILHVMSFLGHKKIDNTLIYVQIDQKLFKDADDGFIVRVAHNVGEAVALIEAGFEYVTGEYCDGGKIFRKRK